MTGLITVSDVLEDPDWEDETVKNTLVTKGGSIVSEIVKGVS